VRCHEGQALDLALRVSELRRGEIASLARAISALKTGALTAFATALGATLAGASPRSLEALSAFGHKVGLVLQMLDDLGSLVSPSRHHKALEDLRGQRVGWGWAWASETVDEVTFKQLVKQLARESELGALRGRLADAVEPLGRMRIRAALQEAERELTSLFAKSQALELVQLELSRLESSYG
jgi:geranylgeranyl pyrophosphate synthase